MRQVLRQFAFRSRRISQAKPDGNIVEASGPKATVEVPQTGHDHADDRCLDVRPRLIKDEKILRDWSN